MTVQPPLPLAPTGSAVPIGDVVALVEDADGGRVFVRGDLVWAWDAGDVATRCLAAVQLVRVRAASQAAVAAGFGVDASTVRRWEYEVREAGAGGLVPVKPGPKGPSKLTEDLAADIVARRAAGASLQAIADAVGVSTDTVRRALRSREPAVAAAEGAVGKDAAGPAAGDAEAAVGQPDPVSSGDGDAAVVVPVLPGPSDRSAERVAARWGLIDAAPPVFAPAGRVPLAGMFAMFPALEATGLLDCAQQVFGGDAGLPGGFYGLDAILVEGVARALLGEARAQGATRVDPVALGRVLGLDRAPEVKTIRRKIKLLASTGRAEDLLAALARHHLATRADGQSLVLFVDGHVRAYTGTRNIGKTHSPRLKFPAPATMETWVADADGDPVLVVMAEPGTSLAGEIRRLLPQLRAAVGDDRRVLVGFDRGGWSPALFAHMHAHGFDALTWRKQPYDDLPAEAFADVSYLDHAGVLRQWRLADTVVELPLSDRPDGQTFTMRQVSRIREDGRQVHLLTTRTDLTAGEVVWRMGTRWRQENHFRYARIRFDLDGHDCYAVTDDDPQRLVPNPAKKASQKTVNAAKARVDRVAARTDAALLALHTPHPSVTEVRISNADHDAVTAELRAAEDDLVAAQDAHKALPTRIPLGQVNPGQLVLDTQVKLLHHAIRAAAYNTMTALARTVRTDTTFKRKDDEAHDLVRAILTSSGDIIPSNGGLTIRLDPLPTRHRTAAMAELLDALTATETTYPGTDLTLRYQAKPGT